MPIKPMFGPECSVPVIVQFLHFFWLHAKTHGYLSEIIEIYNTKSSTHLSRRHEAFSGNKTAWMAPLAASRGSYCFRCCESGPRQEKHCSSPEHVTRLRG